MQPSVSFHEACVCVCEGEGGWRGIRLSHAHCNSHHRSTWGGRREVRSAAGGREGSVVLSSPFLSPHDVQLLLSTLR